MHPNPFLPFLFSRRPPYLKHMHTNASLSNNIKMPKSLSILRSQHEKTINKYIQMFRHGQTPNEHTYPSLLKSLSNSQSQNPSQVHAHILKFGFSSDTFIQNSLVSCYAKCGDLGHAVLLFDEMCHKDAISWTAMIHGHVKNNRPDEGLSLFSEMRALDVEVGEMIVVSVLNACGMIGNVWLGQCVHGFYVECGRVKWDVYVGSALIDMYAKCGDCDDARRVFDEMPCRNVVSWTSLISGYVQCGRFRHSISVFQDMLGEGLEPNLMTLTSILNACSHLGALEQGRWIHCYIDRSGLGLNSIVGTALIDMYVKCGCIDDAFQVFHGLSHKNVYTWTALINGLAMHGLPFQSLDLFSRMMKDGARPNEVTFLGVLCACSHGGLVDQGRMHFARMFEDYGIKPKLEHFSCMVDLLGRAGHLEEALQLIKSMPMEPSGGVWGALFSACMIHKDFALGERIGKLLLQMQPHGSGGYALLANMYSCSGKWEEAANLRIAMKERRVEKVRGVSRIEVDGALHEFISSDESHPQSNEIYENLAGITILMKLEWCLSACHQLLFDMDVR